MASNKIIGIDLGTTNSAVAVMEGNGKLYFMNGVVNRVLWL